MKILKDNQGNVLVKNGSALAVENMNPALPHYTGTVDVEGLTALGWDSEDIAWLQANVWWDAKDNDYWKVTEANLAFGPNGATPLTWANCAEQKLNQDLRFFPKLDQPSGTNWSSKFQGFQYIVAIPTHGWDTTNVTYFGYMFWNCYCLKTVGDVSNWVTSKVTSLVYLFYSCYNLRYIGDISGWDVSNVTNVSYMFSWCNVLEHIGDLSNWNTAKITTMNSMFAGCYLITSVGDLSNWDVSSVTIMGSMFNSCQYLSYIGDLSNWNTSNVNNMNGMFANCRSLPFIGDLSRWDTSKVTSFQGMFNSCFLLKNIGDLSRWNTSLVASFNTMFYSCYSLYELKGIANWDTRNITTISQMFATMLGGCEEIDISGWVLSSCTSVGTNASTTPFISMHNTRVLKLGPHFFDGTPTIYYMQGLQSWTRDSIYESLYTNQTLRNSQSTAITVKLSASAYDRLSQQDKDDIATKNITLTRG